MVLKHNQKPPVVVHHERYAIICPDAQGEATLGDTAAFYGKMVLLKDGRPNQDMIMSRDHNLVGSLCEWCMERCREVVIGELQLDMDA